MRKLFITIIFICSSLIGFSQTNTWKPVVTKQSFEDSTKIQKTLQINGTWRIGAITITSNGAELNILDGALVNTTELNRLVGVTGNVQSQLNGKANTSHTQAQSSVTSLPDSLLNKPTKAQMNTFVRKEIGDSLAKSKEGGLLAVALPDSGKITSGGYATGFDWFNGIETNIIKAGKSVTTVPPIQAYPINCIGGMITGQTTMTDGRAQYQLFYIPEPITVTGVRFVLQTQGNYTADGYNGAKLYKVISASTFVRLDSTANNGDFWKGSVVQRQDFAFVGGTRVLEPGLYVVGHIYNSSAQTAAPAMYSSFNNSSAVNVMYFGNAGANQLKLGGYVSSMADLPVTETFLDLTSETTSLGLFLY